MREILFHDGNTIPQVGFGTAAIGDMHQDDEHVTHTVLTALNAGYRHIDTASFYGNERSVGAAIKASGIPRDELFITTKVWDTQQGFDSTLKACNESLDRLGLEYVDLYLVHWPYPEKTKATWQAMEQLHSEGKVRSLGLSNFRQTDIESLLEFAKVKPVYNQLELHPYMTQKPLVAFCESVGIVVSCWSPLGSGNWNDIDSSEKPVNDDVIIEMAKKYAVSVGQIILKWDVQQGRIVIPKSESESHIRGNITLDDFTLTDDELTQIDNLNQDRRFGDDPDDAWQANLDRPVPSR